MSPLSVIVVTATCRQVSSRPDRARFRLCSSSRVVAVLGMVLLCLAAWASAQSIERLSLGVAGVNAPGLAVHGMALRYEGGAAELVLTELELGTHRWDDLRLRCPSPVVALSGVDCKAGELRLADHRLELEFSLELERPQGGFALLLGLADGTTRIEIQQDGQGEFVATLTDLDLAQLPELLVALPESLLQGLADWLEFDVHGVLDAKLRWQQGQAGSGRGQLAVALQLARFGFSSTDGLHAGEGIELALALRAEGNEAGWDWQLDVDSRAGEAYLHPLYLQAGPSLRAQGRIDDEWLSVDYAEVRIEGVDQLAGTARLARSDMKLDQLSFSLAGGDLALLGPQWLAPLLAPALGERLRFSGHVGAGVLFDEGELQRIDLSLDEVGASLATAVADAGQGGVAWTAGPFSGHLPWRAQAQSAARVEVAGARWGALTLGEFALELQLERRALAVDKVRVPVLDGALVIEQLRLQLEPEGVWKGSGSVAVEPLSMSLLSSALEWPLMAGTLSASLPGMRIEPGEISFDGALVVSVFDGYVRATGLRVSEAFGLASQLHAEVEARHIDLAQLTDTFSFGSISGHIDADLKGFELLQWAPVAFDLQLASSRPRSGGRISQRAVENITALGGGGALAAVQRTLLRIFSSFGYRELGLSAVLVDGVCELRGIDGIKLADGGFPLVRGGGIPALDVIGYNSRVDWQELVERIQRVISDQVVAEVH